MTSSTSTVASDNGSLKSASNNTKKSNNKISSELHKDIIEMKSVLQEMNSNKNELITYLKEISDFTKQISQLKELMESQTRNTKILTHTISNSTTSLNNSTPLGRSLSVDAISTQNSSPSPGVSRNPLSPRKSRRKSRMSISLGDLMDSPAPITEHSDDVNESQSGKINTTNTNTTTMTVMDDNTEGKDNSGLGFIKNIDGNLFDSKNHNDLKSSYTDNQHSLDSEKDTCVPQHIFGTTNVTISLLENTDSNNLLSDSYSGNNNIDNNEEQIEHNNTNNISNNKNIEKEYTISAVDDVHNAIRTKDKKENLIKFRDILEEDSISMCVINLFIPLFNIYSNISNSHHRHNRQLLDSHHEKNNRMDNIDDISNCVLWALFQCYGKIENDIIAKYIQ